MADWLSMNNDIAFAWEMPKSWKILHNQTISHAASHVEIYFSSAEELATVACFLQLQDTTTDPMFTK